MIIEVLRWTIARNLSRQNFERLGGLFGEKVNVSAYKMCFVIFSKKTTVEYLLLIFFQNKIDALSDGRRN